MIIIPYKLLGDSLAIKQYYKTICEIEQQLENKIESSPYQEQLISLFNKAISLLKQIQTLLTSLLTPTTGYQIPGILDEVTSIYAGICIKKQVLTAAQYLNYLLDQAIKEEKVTKNPPCYPEDKLNALSPTIATSIIQHAVQQLDDKIKAIKQSITEQKKRIQPISRHPATLLTTSTAAPVAANNTLVLSCARQHRPNN